MVSKNDVTGDSIQTKTSSNDYRDNWDKIFGKKQEEPVPVEVDVTDGSDYLKRISVVVESFDHIDSYFKDITGKNLEDNIYTEDVVVYEMINAITCCDYRIQDDLEWIESCRKVAIYMLSDDHHQKFNNFIDNWIKEHESS